MNPQPNRYGVSYLATPRNVDALNPLVTGLGVAWARPDAVTTLGAVRIPYSVFQAAEHGFNVTLNVRNTDDVSHADAVVTDPVLYADQLSYILASVQARMQPGKRIVLVVGNEENSALFYNQSGYPDAYAQQLSIAYDTAHYFDPPIPVTNGGITSALAEQVTRYGQTKPLLSYRDSAIDFMNFHYYSDNDRPLPLVADYLADVTGKPVISNEIGQRVAAPEITTVTLQDIERAQLPIAIWYSGPGPTCYPLWALDSFEPTPRYYAFQSFMRSLHLVPEVT